MSKQLAREEIEKLLKLANETYEKDEKLSKRYVELALKIAKRNQVKIGNRRFCKKCLSTYIPGKTVKIRKTKNAIIYTCNCGHVKKFMLDFKKRNILKLNNKQ